MKKSMLWMGKVLVPTILVLVLSIATVPVETAPPLPLVTLTDSTTTYGTVYLDPPTINGTAIGVNSTVTVNLNISDADEINAWQAGLYFNATVLECLEFKEGEFLKKEGSTYWQANTIDNARGVITYHACMLQGVGNASGDGQLAYLKFNVTAPRVSDLHLSNVKVLQRSFEVPSSIIDVYTVVVNATRHTVVTFSNSTGATAQYGSRFYDHSFNQTLKELSFKVSGPHPGFSNVTIPQTLLNVSILDEWIVIIDDIWVSRAVTYNGTHYSIYFTYTAGIHTVQITSRPLLSSVISIALSEDSVTLGSNVTISGNITVEDNTTRAGVPVTIQLWNTKFKTWDTFATVTTDANSNYNYTWTQNEAGTYDFKAKWEGDMFPGTLGAESDVKTLTVLKRPSTIYIELSPRNITLGSNVTISGNITADDPVNPLRPDVDVTIQYKPSGAVNWTRLETVKTTQYSKYSQTFKVWELGKINEAGTYEVKAGWGGDATTEGAESQALTLTVLKIPSTISIAFSEDSVTSGSNVTISGAIDPWRPVETVTIQYRLNGGEWTLRANVTTDANSNYSYTWTPDTAGTYEVMASWGGDEGTEGAESDVLTLEVKGKQGIPLEVVAVVVVVIIIAAVAIVVYFVRFRKPG